MYLNEEKGVLLIKEGRAQLGQGLRGFRVCLNKLVRLRACCLKNLQNAISARVWCDDIMDESATNIRTQQRARDRVKKKINSKFRHMKLADLCHMSGNDYNAALLMAVPPEERAALLLLAEGNGFEGQDEEEEVSEEDVP